VATLDQTKAPCSPVVASTGHLEGGVQACNGFLKCSPSGVLVRDVESRVLCGCSSQVSVNVFPLDVSCGLLNRVHLQHPQHAAARASTTSLHTAWKPSSVVRCKHSCLVDNPQFLYQKSRTESPMNYPKDQSGWFFSH